MVGQDQRRGSTKAGMDWNGMDYWNGLQGSNSLLFFHTLSNRVSIASHTAMKIHGKIVLESMEGSCVRIGPGVDSACTHTPCSKHCHTPDYCRSSHFQRLHIGLPILAILFP